MYKPCYSNHRRTITTHAQDEPSTDEGSDIEHSGESDACSTCNSTEENERYDVEVVTDTDYLLDEALNLVEVSKRS